MRFNSKGQAFDVFKLLIAAVIALAMLMILLPVLQSLGFFITTSPNKVASDLIKSNYNNPSNYAESDPVVFNKQNNSLNIIAIAEQSKQISSNLVCIHSGEFKVRSGTSDVEDFEFTGNKSILRYVGSSQTRARIGVICDVGVRLASDFTQYDLDPLGQIGEVGCGDGTSALPALPATGNQTYCILILRAD